MKKILHCLVGILLLTGSHSLFAQCAPDLIISEYVEGSSNNKYLEIYNGTGGSVSLGGYTIDIYFNNNSTPGNSIPLSGTLADGATYIVANSSAGVFSGTVDLASGSLIFNGNDAVVLSNSGTLIDQLGVIAANVDFGKNKTLRRQTSVITPTTTYNSSEWMVLGTDDVSGLGAHSINCSVAPCTPPGTGTGVSLTPYLSNMEINLTPPPGGADGYMVVLKTTNSIVTPTNGTSYVIGDPFDGGTIVGFGSSDSIVASGLNPNTTYFAFVFAFNASGCLNGPSYAAAISPTPSATTLTANPSTLLPGDLTVIGYDNYAGSSADKIVVTNAKPLGTGTTFIIGNLLYENKAAAGEQTGKWYNGNGNFSFAPPVINVTYEGSGIPAGSVICIGVDESGIGDLGRISIGGVDVTAQFSDDGGDFVQLAVSAPDAIWLMQGTFVGSLMDGKGDNFGRLTNGRVLGAIQTAGAFTDLSTAGNSGGNRISRVHPDIECFAIDAVGSPSGFFGYYDITANPTSGTQHDLLKKISDFSTNWTTGTTSGTSGDPDNISSILCVPSVSFTFTAPAEAGNWIGDTDTDWFNCLNWDNLQVPDSLTGVLVGNDAIADCEIDVSASTLSTKFGNIAKCNDLTVSSPIYKLDLSSGSEDSLFVYGDLILEEGASSAADDGGELDMEDAGGTTGGTLLLYGEWIDNNLPSTLFLEGEASKVIFAGSSQQVINVAATALSPSAGESFAFMEIDNPQGLEIDGRVEVKEELIFNEGIITSASGTPDGSQIMSAVNVLVLADDATVSGASDASHVTGILAKIGDEDFTFPVGDGTYLRPAALEGGSGASPTDEFRIEYFSMDPDGPFTASNMIGVSDAEYWNIEKMGMTGVGKEITLGWDQAKNSDVSDPSIVRLNTIANPSTNFWELAGGSGQLSSTGSGNTGFVTSPEVTNFSPFTFTDANPLPIELIYFRGERQGDQVLLNWETSSEINNSHFILERSSDKESFRPLGQVPASGRRQGIYNWVDQEPLVGRNYYRLIQVDLDGSRSASQVVEVRLAAYETLSLLQAYPNPASEKLFLNLQSPEAGSLEIKVFTTKGQAVMKEQKDILQGSQVLPLETHALASGLYFYQINFKGKSIRGKFTKR